MLGVFLDHTSLTQSKSAGQEIGAIIFKFIWPSSRRFILVGKA